MTFLIIYLVRCAGIVCGDFSRCVNGQCECVDGYIERDEICEETCANSPCKDLIIKPNLHYTTTILGLFR